MRTVHFFGCIGGPGHFFFAKNAPRIDYYQQPFGNLDTGILEEQKVPERLDGTLAFAQKDGWTVISFWDRSGGDTRPACNAAFLIQEIIEKDELLELARQEWPEIFSRPGFPIKQKGTNNEPRD